MPSGDDRKPEIAPALRPERQQVRSDFMPPNSVRVVDAVTGRPLAGMNVGLQVFSNGFTKQALRSGLGDNKQVRANDPA
jgi:hypothetical protein